MELRPLAPAASSVQPAHGPVTVTASEPAPQPLPPRPPRPPASPVDAARTPRPRAYHAGPTRSAIAEFPTPSAERAFALLQTHYVVRLDTSALALAGLAKFRRIDPAFELRGHGLFYAGEHIGDVASPATLAAVADALALVSTHSRRIAERSSPELGQIFIAGMRDHLDRYTRYFTPTELTERVDGLAGTSVSVARRDPDIAVLTIASFTATTAAETRAALVPLVRDGVNAVIIDLRGNGGGLLDASADTADLFLASGTTLDQRARTALYAEHRTASPGDPFENVRVAIVTDGATASAAESFTAALVDVGRAVQTGRPTYGKGTAQTIQTLPSGEGFAFSVAEFVGPTGRPINGVGRVPSACADQCVAEPSNVPADIDRAAAILAIDATADSQKR